MKPNRTANHTPLTINSLKPHSLIHMVGIGGSGMSGLALLLKGRGFRVAGSDIGQTTLTESLKKSGVRVFHGHAARNISPSACLVVYSSAVHLGLNPEILEAKRRGIALLRRGSALAQISRLGRSITVSGTHGKTTTSSMAGLILAKAGLRPTVIVGGEIRNTRSNAFLGKSDIFVLETDESDGSFLETRPWIGIVTNVDNDHLEHYGTMSDLIRAFKRHLETIGRDGWAVLCGDDPALAKHIIGRTGIASKIYGFGLKADCRAAHLSRGLGGYSFDLIWEGKRVGRIKLLVPGKHNVLNALAAAASAHLAGVSWPRIAQALSEYKGIRRRLEVLGVHGGVLLLDDYGHHPTEIAATLSAARDFYAKGRLLACFQPHRFSRTKELHRDFGGAFQKADFVWVCPIYAASEKPLPGVSEDLVLKSLKKAGIPCERFPGAPELRKRLRPGDTLMTIGAGDVWKIGEDLVRRMY